MDLNARSKNFSSEEIEMLLNIVKAHSSILENKKTGKVRPCEKEKAWNAVTDEFNAVCGGAPRSAKVLRTKYGNLKADMKKRSAEHKKYLYGTGGGPPKQPVSDEYDSILSEIISEKQIKGMKSFYDNDVLAENVIEYSDEALSPTICEQPSLSQNQSLFQTSPNYLGEEYESIEMEIQPENSSHHFNSRKTKNKLKRKATLEEADIGGVKNGFETWENYTESQLKTPKNKKLCVQKGKNKENSWSKLAEVKAKWSSKKLRNEIEIADTEHKLRLAQMTELHNSKIEYQEMKKKCLKEKHELEMKTYSDALDFEAD